MSYSQLSKAEIQDEQRAIEEAKKNPEKFEFLYDRYFSDVFGFVFNRTSNRQICSDITSQVFLKAMLNIKKYKNKGVPFSAWLFRISVNEISTFYRQTKRERSISIDQAGAELFAENLDTDLGKDQYSTIIKILDTLPDSSVRLIEMRFFENRPYSEIADILDISVSNAKVKVHRVLQKIKKKTGKTLLQILIFFTLFAIQ